jgi:hypothetical protein
MLEVESNTKVIQGSVIDISGKLIAPKKGSLPGTFTGTTESVEQAISGNVVSVGLTKQAGRNSMVECQLPKLEVGGSIPVARSSFFQEFLIAILEFNRNVINVRKRRAEFFIRKCQPLEMKLPTDFKQVVSAITYPDETI